MNPYDLFLTYKSNACVSLTVQNQRCVLYFVQEKGKYQNLITLPQNYLFSCLYHFPCLCANWTKLLFITIFSKKYIYQHTDVLKKLVRTIFTYYILLKNSDKIKQYQKSLFAHSQKISRTKAMHSF